MVKRFLYSLAFLLLACGKSGKDKLIDELVPILGGVAQAKIEEAEFAHANIFSRAGGRSEWPESIKNKMRSYIEESDIDETHAIAGRFYEFTQSFIIAYQYNNKYPKEELITRFNLSFDSISVFLSEDKTHPFDYSQSRHVEDLTLTIIRMNYDIATLEYNTMNYLARGLPTIIYDEFPAWGEDSIYFEGDRYVKIKTQKKK